MTDNYQVSDVLAAHMPTLRSVYRQYSSANEDPMSSVQSPRLLSLGEWTRLISDLALGGDGIEEGTPRMLSLHQIQLIFSWSRIRSVADYSSRSQVRLRHLQFEDFLEALVRTATMVPLPLDADISHMGCAHAGEYIMQLRGEGKAAVIAFFEARAQSWEHEPHQRIWRCVDHLLHYITHMIEVNASRADVGEGHSMAADLSVSANEAKAFMKMSNKPEALRRRQSHVQRETRYDDDGEAIENEFLDSFDSVRAKLIGRLTSAPIFEHLKVDQISALVDEMELAPFEADAFVFEQGDVGDRFYVILTGEAKVLRDEQGLSDQPISSEEIEFEDPEKLLADLGPGSYFGERALLKSEPRFASVQAKTALTTMCLTPACCERALGRPLKDCVPDIY